MKTIPKGLCTELIILTWKWTGTETALNYLTILIDFWGNFLLCNQTWFHQSMSFFLFGMQELRTLFFNPRSPRYYLTLIWFLSSSCSSFQQLWKSFAHIPWAGRELISSYPGGMLSQYHGSSLHFSRLPFHPFYPWLFAWHSHANGFGLLPPVCLSSTGSFLLLILFSPSFPYNIRNVPTLKYGFIKSRLKMTFANCKCLWVEFVSLTGGPDYQ